MTIAVRTMLCRSWFRRSAVKLPAVPRILMACFAVLLAAPGLSAADEETNWTVLTVARNGNYLPLPADFAATQRARLD